MHVSDLIFDNREETAYRLAEKRYKLYYQIHSKKKRVPKNIDLSEVVDFKFIVENFDETGVLPPGVKVPDCEFSHRLFCLEDHPGFYFIPGALNLDEQCKWIREGLMSFPQPPNRTNHNVLYGPIRNLFKAAERQKHFVLDHDSVVASGDGGTGLTVGMFCEETSLLSSNGMIPSSISATSLLRKLRWSTLGLQFDWSKRNYDLSLLHSNMPDELCDLAKRMALPAMPSVEGYKPEAAIVNYFGPGDTLGGHLDDMEADWSKPIVSISLGCKAIFLLGGKSRGNPPVPMFVRSGDVILMSGEARQCYHGVPRIFTGPEIADISHLEGIFSAERDAFLLEYIRTSRININIRQVFSDG